MSMATPKVPQNFHALYDRSAREARGIAIAAAPASPAAHPAVARMAAEVPNLAVHLDEATSNPVQITTIPGVGRVSTRAAPTPEAAARQFVQDRADLWKLDNQDLGTVNVVSVSTTAMPTVRMVQKVDGVEVFQSDMTAALGKDNSVVSV